MALTDNTKLVERLISATGIINLPLKVREALGFLEGESKILQIQIEKGLVRIAAAEKDWVNTHEASPLGLLQLPKEAHHLLSNGKEGSYTLTPESELQGKGSDQVIYLRSV